MSKFFKSTLALCLLALLPSLAKAQASDLFFSEYVEGSTGSNKVVEIYNGTSAPVDLAAGVYTIQLFFNGSATAGQTISPTGTIAVGAVYRVAVNTFVPTAELKTNQLTFNGDDAVTLRKNGVVIDAIGQVGLDPGTQWGTDPISTADNTIRRKSTVCAGDTNPTDVFDPSVEWDGFADNDLTGLGAHSANCAATPVLSISNAATTGEGNPGCVDNKLVYPVTSVPAPASSLAFTATISGGTADGADVGTLATVNVDTSGNGSVEVPIVCDRVIEGDETVQVTLDDGAAYDLGTASANGTIENDDVGVIRITSVSQAEGTGANSTFAFNVAMDNGVLAGAGGVGMDYEVVSAGATPATADVDFTAVATTAHTIPAGQNAAAINVTVIADSDDEPNETFAVNLSNGTGASIGDNQAIGTIENDDATIPQISVDDVTVTEGDTGSANLTFTLNIDSPPTGANVVLDYATVNGSAIGGSDFTPTAGQLTFLIGSNASQQINVPILGDCTIESPASETFTVNLSIDSGSATVDPSATGTIDDNDVAITADISVAPASANEGDSGTNARTVTVTLSQAMQCGDFTYSIATSGGATSGTDYQAFSVSNATIGGATTQATHTLNIIGDLIDEADEDVVLTLTGTGTNVGGLPDAATATITDDDSAPLTIEQIQGDGISSPVAGQVVITLNNIVTAVQPSPNGGFFIQMPDAQASANVFTSNAVFVFTGATPSVVVGDEVHVKGSVLEFGSGTPAQDVTEFGAGGLVIVPVSSGNTLPAAIQLNDAIPSPEASMPFCAGGTYAPTDPFPVKNFECLEGMRVAVARGVIATGNQAFGAGDPYAEMFFTTSGMRAFREPGIAANVAAEDVSLAIVSPPAPPLPAGYEFDMNLELFEIDPNKLVPGTPNNIIPPGSVISGAGVLQQEFNDYEFWPATLSVDEPQPTLPVAVSDAQADQLTIGSLNLLRLYDRCNDPARTSGETTSLTTTARKLRKISSYVRNVLKNPIILGVQEAEHASDPSTICSNAPEVPTSALQLLADQIQADGGPLYTAVYAGPSNDPGWINNGVLYRADLISGATFQQLRANEEYSFTYTDGSGPPVQRTSTDLLHDRPSILMQGTTSIGGAPLSFAVMVNHLRSFNGIDDISDTYSGADVTVPTIHQNAHRVRQKRLRQAIDVACEVQTFQVANPATPLVVIGDFNAFEYSDGYGDSIGIIRGDTDPSLTEYDIGFDNTPRCAAFPNGQIVSPTLVEAMFSLPVSQQYSYVFDNSAQTLDHALLTAAARARFERMAFGRGNADAPAREENQETPGLEMLYSSDHDGFVIYLNAGADATNDGFLLFRDSFED